MTTTPQNGNNMQVGQNFYMPTNIAPLPTSTGTLATGPITVAASASYTSPQLATAGYRNATLLPASLSGTLGSAGGRQNVQGVLAYYHNASSEPPPGMTINSGAVGFLEPINDAVYGVWINGSSTASMTLGDILYSMT